MTEQTTTQKEMPFTVLFVLVSAAVGPLIFRPPLWDQYRKQQVVGFTIGFVAWAIGLGAVLQVIL